MNNSPFLRMQQVSGQIGSILVAVDIYELDPKSQKLVARLKQNIADARLDIRDYELSETRDDQLRNAKAAKKRLNAARKDILAASEYNLFGAADVAQLTASLEQISDGLY